MFRPLLPSPGQQHNILNYGKMECIHTYSPYGVTMLDPTSLQCLLQYGTVKSGHIVADCL